MFALIRRFLFGKPLASSRQIHERLGKFLALPVFSSDAVSSVAYGPQEVMIALVIIGAAAWHVSLPIGVMIAVLIAIVTMSYRQTIFAYPHGGGSYIVTKENIGLYPGLVAAASILTDYVLTVAVSISAGIDAFIAAYPAYSAWRVDLCIMAIGVVALANLRGIRESGSLFAGPTYLFIISLYGLVGVGIYKYLTGALSTPIVSNLDQVLHSTAPAFPQALTALIVLKAFSNGCSALTGIEAIADGVPAFKPPESRNAAATMVYMAIILGTLVLGITFLGHAFHALPGPAMVEHGLKNLPNYAHLKDQTLVSQLAEHVFGRSWFYFIIQWSTTFILVLAANTAFLDFPRLSSILARDRCGPRQLANLGDKLVYSNGILLLSLLAGTLLIMFKGNTTALIPLYAVGVFISFTLSQWGMATRTRRLKSRGWRANSTISSFGACVTAGVALIIAYTKFAQGAWIVVLLIPSLVFVFHKIHQHYLGIGDQLRLTPENFKEPSPVRSTAIVLCSGIHKGILPALEYARTLSHDCRALFIEIDPIETSLIRDRWESYGLGVPLVILESPYRSVMEPIINYLEEAKKERPGQIITVVVPEFVPAKWWHRLLHTQSGFFLKWMLMFRRDIVVTNVRYYLEE